MPRPLALVVLLLAVLSRAALADYQAGVRAWGHADYAAAAAAFQSAAEAGEPESQYMMGRLYALGDGVPRDFVQAWLWFDRAARQGHADAAESRAMLDHVLNQRQLALVHQLAVPPPARAQSQPQPQPQAQPPAQLAEQPGARPLLLLPRRSTVEMGSANPPWANQQQAAR